MPVTMMTEIMKTTTTTITMQINISRPKNCTIKLYKEVKVLALLIPTLAECERSWLHSNPIYWL